MVNLKYEEFMKLCEEPVDIEQCLKALKEFVARRATMHIPVRLDDPDILIGRALNQLGKARADIKELVEVLRDLVAINGSLESWKDKDFEQTIEERCKPLITKHKED